MVRSLSTTLATIAATLLGVAARAQCCRGAMNAEEVSSNGLYKVEAISLTGTGFQVHGPYHYRFKWSEKAGTGFEEKSSFEVKVESQGHCNLAIYVSPAGNGFLLDFGPAPNITFYGTTGHPIRSYTRQELMIPRSAARSGDPLFLKLLDPDAVPVPGMENAFNYIEKGELLLPLGAPVGPELEARLLALLAPDATARQRVGELLAALDAEDPRDQVTELIRIGVGAIDLIEKAAGEGSAPARTRAAEVLRELQSRTAGFRDPLNNPRLMAVLLRYPSGKVATLASNRLTALLPKRVFERIKDSDFAKMSDWLLAHALEFRWDERSRSYRWE